MTARWALLVSYPCVEFLDDELALVGYHARDGIHVARIKIDWFYEQ